MPTPKTKQTSTKNDEKTGYIQLMVTALRPDRSSYKQYGIELVPKRVAVSVPVPLDQLTVVFQKDGEGKETELVDYVILTLDGLMSVTGTIADKVDDLHNLHLSKLQRGTR